MFGNLINFDPEPPYVPEAPAPDAPMVLLDDAQPGEIVAGQKGTSDWLQELGVPSVDDAEAEIGRKRARETFGAITTAAADPAAQREQLLTLKAPDAVQHLVGMLTAYDWEFVNHAKELRNFAVGKILEDCEHPKPEVRLKALGLLGKVTEVGLFTDKVEITKKDMSDEELDAKIRERMSRLRELRDLAAPAAPVTDVEAKPAAQAPVQEA